MIINGIKHEDSRLDGITIEQGEPFELSRNTKRAGKVDSIGAHEPGGLHCERTLRKKRGGVHGIIYGGGEVVMHNDIATDTLNHCVGMNGRSVAFELVNTVYPPVRLPWSDVIDAPWVHKKRYVVPTLEQLESFTTMVDVLTSASWDGVEIPREFPGLHNGMLAMGRCPAAHKKPGIFAHTYTAHSDGSFPVLYAYLRLVLGLGTHDARPTAMVLARKGRVKWRDGGWWADVEGA